MAYAHGVYLSVTEQATTHADDPLCFIDAGVACATPLNMPANSANLQRPFHKAVYDVNLGTFPSAGSRPQAMIVASFPLRRSPVACCGCACGAEGARRGRP